MEDIDDEKEAGIENESDEEYEEKSEMGSNKEKGDEKQDANKSTVIFQGLPLDTAALTEFQKKMLFKDSKTKRQKKLEKKAKLKVLFNNLYDQKSGETAKGSFFGKWRKAMMIKRKQSWI